MLTHIRRLSTAHHRQFLHAGLVPMSQRLFSSFPLTDASRRTRLMGEYYPPLYAPTTPLAVRIGGLQHSTLRLPMVAIQMRSFARRSGRNSWDSNDSGWLSTVKTGALLAVGAGAVVAAASVGFGFVVFGAAGYGIYTLYQRFFAPYRSNDPFSSVQADIDRIFNNRQTTRTQSSAPGAKDLDSLVEGLPFIVRGFVKTLFSFAGGAMKNSMARAGELRRLANDAMRANATIVSQMGTDVSISTPQNWMEYTVNGAGRVEAVFPVVGEGYSQAQVSAKASIGTNGAMTLLELKYRNDRTGEVIDLLRDAGPSVGRRKKVVEAEYVDLDDRK